MDKLLPEFQKIVDDLGDKATFENIDNLVHVAVTRAQELALRRPEMSVNEISDAFYAKDAESFIGRAEQLLAAYESKRFQPIKRVVKCRLYRKQVGYFNSLGSAGCPEYGPQDCAAAIRALRTAGGESK